MVRTGVADFKVYVRALLKVAYIHKLYFTPNFKVATRDNIFETVHLKLKYITYTDTLLNT